MSETRRERWSRGQILTVTLLTIGYMGYYECRSHLSVSSTSIIEEFAAQGLTKEGIGAITSIGTLFYALGKFLGGSFADRFGGRTSFLTGMLGAAFFTVLFALGGPGMFVFAWSGNRLIQAFGWPGMVRVVGHWFSPKVFGTSMGLVSLSYLFGPFLSKLMFGALFDAGWGWRQLFFLAAACLGAIFVACALLLRESPSEASPAEVENPVISPKPGARQILRKLVTNRAFWIVCVLSFGFTLLRETFNNWSPTYLELAAGLTKGDASRASSLFDLFGAISVLIVGGWSDKLGQRGRALLIGGGLTISTGLLAILAASGDRPGTLMAIGIVASVALVMIGPYSMLAGSISLDMGGKEGGATASGWIDGVGYLGGIISGWTIGKLAEQSGWGSAFGLLAITAAISAGVAAYWYSGSSRKT